MNILSPYFYIDMELCELNLEEHIYEDRVLNVHGKQRRRLLLPLNTNSIWGIMRDISEGLAFIHENKEVHRDLKPTNGNIPPFMSVIISSIFWCKRCLEDWGLRLFHGESICKHGENGRTERNRELSGTGTIKCDGYF
jgi:serine/threonine protein kinase